MSSTHLSHRSPSVRVPTLRHVLPGEPGYPLSDGRWQGWTRGPVLFDPQVVAPPIACIGSMTLLQRPRISIVCSGHCPGTIALETYRIARNALPEGPTVIGGFHSPMERTVFDLLTTRHVPVVVCPGRRIQSRSVPSAWAPAIVDGRLLVISPFAPEKRRVDRDLAGARNAFVAALADTVVVPYARPGGAVAALVMTLLEMGRKVLTLQERETEGLVVLGAEALATDDLIGLMRAGGEETKDPGFAGRDPFILQ
jgi:predicted Rossmann fold nucleotide-binding protein DprA/Smf involved in DNA uptake